jgi:hypothetical protein
MSPSRQYSAERQHPASSKPIDFSSKMRAHHRELLRRRKRFFDLRTRHRKSLLKDLGELLSASGNLASLRGSGANFVRCMFLSVEPSTWLLCCQLDRPKGGQGQSFPVNSSTLN